MLKFSLTSLICFILLFFQLLYLWKENMTMLLFKNFSIFLETFLLLHWRFTNVTPWDSYQLPHQTGWHSWHTRLWVCFFLITLLFFTLFSLYWYRKPCTREKTFSYPECVKSTAICYLAELLHHYWNQIFIQLMPCMGVREHFPLFLWHLLTAMYR